MKELPTRLFHLLLVMCGLMAIAVPCNTQATPNDTGTVRATKVVTVVWGIISYTRWPDEKKQLRVCLPEDGARHVTLIRESAKEVKLGRSIVVTSTPPDAVKVCDVVYFPAVQTDTESQLLRSLIGAPVLTIGEGETFCSAGGMYCLLVDTAIGKITDRFAANLDAISRSSLRVHPQVLRLSKRRELE